MARQTPESLLISAAINSYDPYYWKQWGMSARNFFGHRDEAEWLEMYVKDFGRCPTWDEFLTKWPDFNDNRTFDEGKWAATEVIGQYNTRTATRQMLKASNLLKRGEVDDGLELLRSMDTHKVVDAPQNVLVNYDLLDNYHTEEDRVALPWDSLQSRTNGIGKGELWYLAARPSQGKSALTSYMAAKAALDGRNVIVYSMEMSHQATMIRLQTMMAHMLGFKGITHQGLRRRTTDPRDYKRLIEEIDARVTGHIHVHTPRQGPCRPSVVAARAGDYDLNVVDYIGLMRPDGNGRAVDDWRTMAAISNELKEIALARDTRVVAASQINRDGDGILPPKLKNLSQSDALGQDGDVVATLVQYKKRPGAAHLSLEKNREGETHIQWFTEFDVNNGSFDEITRDEADDIADDNEAFEQD